MSLWWAAALIAPAVPAEAPSLAAWNGHWTGEGQASGKPVTATLDIVPDGGGATRLAYRLSIAGPPPLGYSADANYAVDAKGRVRGNGPTAMAGPGPSRAEFRVQHGGRNGAAPMSRSGAPSMFWKRAEY